MTDLIFSSSERRVPFTAPLHVALHTWESEWENMYHMIKNVQTMNSRKDFRMVDLMAILVTRNLVTSEALGRVEVAEPLPRYKLIQSEMQVILTFGAAKPTRPLLRSL
jgi:Trp operon repressor